MVPHLMRNVNRNNDFMNCQLLDAQNIVLQEILTNLRAEAQLTQKQLSQKLNRPQSYVSKYESGERKLTLIEIREIVISCGSNLHDFIRSFEEELKVIER